MGMYPEGIPADVNTLTKGPPLPNATPGPTYGESYHFPAKPVGKNFDAEEDSATAMTNVKRGTKKNMIVSYKRKK